MPSQEPRTVARAPVRHTATAVSSMVVVTCAAGAFGAWATWRRYQVAVDYVAGEPGVGVAAYVGAENVSDNTGVVWLLAHLVTAVMFLTWLWRARCNAELLSPLPHRLTRGWAVGGWLVPVLNLTVPRTVLEDVWRTSRPGAGEDVEHARELPRAWLVRYWWLAVLACAATGLWLSLAHRVEPTTDTLWNVAALTTLLTALEVVAAALVLPLVHQVTRWQEERLSR
jgi:hypothetical protein